MKERFIIGSRGSHLALWQANHIAAKLEEMGITPHIEIIRTSGDRMQTASLVKAGGKGLFTKEIEDALLEGEIDLAVHSLKDLPTENTPGLTIAAVPQRENPFDALVGAQLADLPRGARIGTSSNRRAAQLRLLRGDLRPEAVRGNVDTRLRKLSEGQFDAVMLAAAGLRRLGLADRIAQVFDPTEICPAPGQGALALQTRVSDEAGSFCRTLNHEDTERSVRCERALLAALGGGCELPIGAYAFVEGERLRVVAGVFSLNGGQSVTREGDGPSADPEGLGKKVAEDLIEQGARGLLGTAKHE